MTWLERVTSLSRHQGGSQSTFHPLSLWTAYVNVCMSNHSIDSIKTPHMSLYSVLTSGRLPKDTEMKIQWVKHSLIKRTIVRELNLLVSYRDQLNLHSGNYTFIFVQLIYFINRFIWLMSNIDVSFTLDIEVGHYFKPDQDLFKIWCSKVI